MGGMDYDLYLYDGCTLQSSSTNRGEGLGEMVCYSWNSLDKYIEFEIRYYSGENCSPWKLSIYSGDGCCG